MSTEKKPQPEVEELVADDDELVVDADVIDDDPSVEADLPAVLDPGDASLTTSDAPVSRSATAGVVKYDAFEAYLSEIRNIPSLTREEEQTLARQYRETEDPQAAYQLVVANLRLVVMIAREYQRNVNNVLDLIQEGNIGLLEAVKQFDPFRGIRFPSYAVYWIRAYMLRYIIQNLRLVKIGTTQAQRKLFFNLQKEKEKLEAEGFIPEAKLLAERLNVKESEVIEMDQRLSLPDLSVDAPVRGPSGNDTTDMHGLLPSGLQNAEEIVVEEQFGEAVRGAVEEFKSTLDEKEKAIVDGRLFTEEPVTLQVIADQFQLSRERIRQIESRLKNELRTFLQNRLALDTHGEVQIEEDGKARTMTLVLIVVLIVTLLSVSLGWERVMAHPKFGFYLSFFEQQAPEVTFVNPPPGVGANGQQFHIQVSDRGTGLDEVIVRAEQGADVVELFRKNYTTPTKHEDIVLTIDGKKSRLTEGGFRLHVSAFDRAFWSNSGSSELDSRIDYRKPKLQVVSVQHNAVIGGTELVFYRATDSDLTRSGARIGQQAFLGSPARTLALDFSSVSDLRFAFFSIPLAYQEESDPVLVFAEDAAGNSVSNAFYYRAARIRVPARRYAARDFLDDDRAAKLVLAHLKRIGTPDPGNYPGRFRLVVEQLRAHDEEELRSLLSKEPTDAIWKEQFSRIPTTMRSDFGEMMRFLDGEVEIATAVSSGVDFSANPGEAIGAANDGTVIFSGDRGSFGETVVVDHGSGLSTIYANLADRGVASGAKVTRGQTVGSGGGSGFARPNTMHFEFRVHGIAVRPVEWWDKNWVKDHVLTKMQDVRSSVGIGAQAGE